MTTRDQIAEQRQEIEERKKALRKGLPHLHERKWYHWAWKFFTSRNKMTLLCAGNQLSKSSSQIRKAIEWAGNPTLWPELWPNHTPRVFWYFYPDKATVKAEVEKKWIPEFLPRGEFKDHPTYGWKIVYGDRKEIEAIEFNSGITIFFKVYTQNISNLQSGTIAAIFADEEMPEAFYSELNARLIASNGYFSMVFTATLNQQMWKRAIEGKGDNELFPQASKQQVSMYDCLEYMDGTPGAFTKERVSEVIASCKSEAEVQRRVFGKFVVAEGLKYPTFDPTRHYRKMFKIPDDWHLYCGVDLGSGGENHKPAIAFVAVQPDYRYGFAFQVWKGDDGSTYTNGDVFNKFLDMRRNKFFVTQRYDWGAKDFGTISARAGEAFVKAEKSHELGEDVINTLFANDMLHIIDDDEGQKLGGELSNLLKETPKNKAQDDLTDALRYAVVTIPWDWSALKGEKSEVEKNREPETRPLTAEEYIIWELEQRRGVSQKKKEDDWSELEREFEEFNEFAGCG